MSAAEVQPPVPIVPDAAMVAAYAEAVFGYCEGFVAVRALAEKGGPDRAPHTPFLPADGELAAKLAVQARWAADSGMALYVIPGTVAAPARRGPSMWCRCRPCWSISTMATSPQAGAPAAVPRAPSLVVASGRRDGGGPAQAAPLTGG